MSAELTPERLEKIRQRAASRPCNSDWHETCTRKDHSALIAEVDRLRGIEARVRAMIDSTERGNLAYIRIGGEPQPNVIFTDALRNALDGA